MRTAVPTTAAVGEILLCSVLAESLSATRQADAKFGRRQILATAEALVKAEKRKIVAALTPVQLRAEIA